MSNMFISQIDDTQQIVIGNGECKDELQKSGEWIAIEHTDAVEVRP